jgi:CRISPR-associated exonuclease Cas4
MYREDELVALSALQHFVVCQRQCALIHLENCWIENVRTAEGRLLHERADRGGAEIRAGVRRAFGVPLRSLALGLSGRADMVEFYPAPGGGPDIPFPVEFKRGKQKQGDEDRIQLCAQALCLEEMLAIAIPAGALFYGERRRRTDVIFDPTLRARTKEMAAGVHALMRAGITPQPPQSAPCAQCSLRPACRPEAFRAASRSVADWTRQRLRDA